MKTEEFVKLMTGHFDNAQHVNTVCNDKINNIPEDFHGIFIVEDKNTFSYDSMKNVDYSKLKKSEKFTPALYHENGGVWEGGSTSRFSPVMTFKLWEKFSDSCLEVSESMEANGKRTFGYDAPIIYKLSLIHI